MSEGQRFTCKISGGGIAAQHPSQDTYSVFVGPSTSNEYNTIRVPLLPRACWRLEDVRFDFDSSFINPPAAEEFKNLATLMKTHPGAPISIFGHADPVGNDDYNKKLSGRRASAVYGMITRNTDIWEELYSNPLGRDDWGIKVVQIILLDLGYPPGPIDGKKGDQTTKAVKNFQTDNGLPPSGNADRATRAKLFLAYMDKHCKDESGNPFKVEDKDFLARGEDSGGKGDYQGCSEFNPLLMFSSEENRKYSKPENKAERDTENAPNRRVLVYLFRPGSHVSPSWWPCPRVKEGVAGCYKRFWSDAAKRRSFQEERREYDKTHDTFACRFYDRLSVRSPCETMMKIFRIRLFDPFVNPIAYAPYRISVGQTENMGKADSNGWAFAKDVVLPNKAVVEWGYPPMEDEESKEPPKLVYKNELSLDIGDEDEMEGARQRLYNLGYRLGKTLEDHIKDFQRAYKRPQTGRLQDIKEDLWKYHDSADPPPLPDSSSAGEEDLS